MNEKTENKRVYQLELDWMASYGGDDNCHRLFWERGRDKGWPAL